MERKHLLIPGTYYTLPGRSKKHSELLGPYESAWRALQSARAELDKAEDKYETMDADMRRMVVTLTQQIQNLTNTQDKTEKENLLSQVTQLIREIEKKDNEVEKAEKDYNKAIENLYKKDATYDQMVEKLQRVWGSIKTLVSRQYKIGDKLESIRKKDTEQNLNNMTPNNENLFGTRRRRSKRRRRRSKRRSRKL